MTAETQRRLHGFVLGALLAGSAFGQTAPPPPPETTTVQGGVESQNLNSGSENLQAIGAFQTSIRRNEPVLGRARKGSSEAREVAARLVSSYEGLGIAYVQNGENGKAIEALTRAIELSRDVLEREDENALYARSLSYGRTGRPQDSIADLEKLLQGKDNLQYREELAAAYVKIGRKDDAAGHRLLPPLPARRGHRGVQEGGGAEPGVLRGAGRRLPAQVSGSVAPGAAGQGDEGMLLFGLFGPF